MRDLDSGISSAILDGRLTSFILCWKITKKDGSILRGTEHDRDIVIATSNFDLEGTYLAEFNITGSDIKSTSDLAVDNLEVEGATDQVFGITMRVADIESGILDGASAIVFLVDWTDPDGGQQIVRAGYIGAISRDSNTLYRAEIRGLRQKLSQTIGQNYSEQCNVVRFGDERCKFDVSTITSECSVVSIFNRRRFVAIRTNAATIPSQFVRGGEVTWTSGLNTGFTREVKGMVYSAGDDAFDIELYEESPDEIQVGDTVDVVPGCDRQASTCAFIYDNFVNYRGYGIFVPGLMAIMRGNSITECVVPTFEPQPPAPTVPGEEPSEPTDPDDPDDSDGPIDPGGPTLPTGPILPGGPVWGHGATSWGITHLTRLPRWESWIGHRADVMGEFAGAQAFDNWNDWENINAIKFLSLLNALQTLGRHTTPIVLTWSMIPNIRDTLSNRRFQNPGMWDDFAAGAFDDHYHAMAARMVNLCEARGRNPNTIYWRLGHEMTGNWYPWSVGDKIDEFKESWERSVAIVREHIPGAVFSIEPARRKAGVNQDVPLEDFLPAANSFSCIGRSLHNSPYPAFVTNDATWNLHVNGDSSRYGLQQCVDSARARGKKFVLSEWASPITDCGGEHRAAPAGSGPLFIQKTYQFLVANQDIVGWDTYFSPGCTSLDTRPTHENAIMFKSLWGA